MRKIRRIRLAVLASGILLLTVGCTSKLPNYGAFINSGMGLTELTPIKGGVFTSQDFANLPNFPEAPESVIFWQPQYDLQNISFTRAEIFFIEDLGIIKSVDEVFFKASPLKNEALELKPTNELDKGVYCVGENIPIGNDLDANYYCFSVQNGANGFFISATETAQVIAEATESAAELTSRIWDSEDGEVIRNLVTDAQQVLYDAFSTNNPGLLDDYFTSDAVNATGMGPREISELFRCKNEFGPRVLIFLGDINKFSKKSGQGPKAYDLDHIGVPVSLNLKRGTGVYCFKDPYEIIDLSKTERVYELGQELCFFLVRTGDGWRIRSYTFGDAKYCDLENGQQYFK